MQACQKKTNRQKGGGGTRNRNEIFVTYKDDVIIKNCNKKNS